ncbi:hypothetical protein Dda_0542 [Drechslerella dactyloides]|uniref:DRBM domain-containing protein n=1 Tax=Drechslerella dactyloides TaxID=74499 RepID=A0AAD6J5E9_DREDA|nr:hypothetical protein Dda_0542 [Drechslerella dactyloides]
MLASRSLGFNRIKQEPYEYSYYSSSPDMDPPPTYSQRHDHPSSPRTSPPKSGFGMDFMSEIGGIPFAMKLKPVTQYLEDGPAIPVKNTKPPARPVEPQTFSSLPVSVKQDPRDPTRVVGERNTTSYVSELYEYIQGHCPRHPVQGFFFDEPHQQQFTVILRLQGLDDVIPPYDRKGEDDEDTPRLFPSKKAAKEYVAMLALERLKNLPTEPTHIVVGPGRTKAESPMGELNRYCSQNALARPHVLDTGNSKPPYYFGCEITIDINGERRFGDPNPNYPNKASARNAAAQQALDWISRENPKIVKVKHRTGKAGRVLAPGSLVQIDATGKTIGEVATEACALLGFKAPQRELVPVDQLQGMYNVYITLEHAEQISRVGPIKNIFGQKAAREEAMKLTLRTLQYLAEEKYNVRLEVTGRPDFELVL